MTVLSRLRAWFPRLAPVEFEPLDPDRRARVDARLRAPARTLPPDRWVALLDTGDGAFAARFDRVAAEVRRRCKDAEVWQSFYLDLLDEDGEVREEGEGVGADPVGEEEELARLLAGVAVYPSVRSRYAWELGYGCLRQATVRGPADRIVEVARAAAEEFLLAFDAAKEAEGKVAALGELAGTHFLAGEEALALALCDYAAELSAEEAVRQELHRLRKERTAYVKASYGG